MEEIEEISSSVQSRRWCFTINNPLGTDIEDIDLSTTALEVKSDYYDKSVIKSLEDSECFIFKYVKVVLRDGDFSTKEYLVRRPFFKSIEKAQEYFESLESFKYCIFQLEKGEEEETEHFQGFIIFNGGKRFRTIKSFLPIAHLEKAKGSNVQCREYCSKTDTRIEGPFEFGKFAEERERTDIKEFVELVKAGSTRQELARLHPQLYLKELNKINNLYADNYEDYSYMCRDIDVTFIYGSAGAGKSTYVRKQVGDPRTLFGVNTYDNSMFTNYRFQDNLLLDEFTDKLDPQHFNRMLDIWPYEMRGLGVLRFAAFHHVYIVSNYSWKELYKTLQQTDIRLYKALNRRIHKIIHFEDGKPFIERDTDWEECTDSYLKSYGITKQVKRIWEYDSYGNKITIYSRDGVPEFQEVKNIDIPFMSEDEQQMLGLN